MNDWRSQTSENAQADLDALLNATLPFAQDMLSKHGEFYPYGATLDHSGEVALTAADQSLGDHPDSAALLTFLTDTMRARAADIRAAAIASNVTVDGSDAVRVHLEHARGPALDVFLPYRRSRLSRRMTYDELAAAPASRLIWT